MLQPFNLLNVLSYVVCFVQDMVTVETFVDFIRKKDVGRIRFAIRETLYDLDSTDEVGKSRSLSVIQRH